MKIIFAPKEVVETFWNRLQPQQRVYGEIGLSVKLPWEEAILVAETGSIEFGRIIDTYPSSDSSTLVSTLRKKIDGGEYQKLELKPVE